MIGVDDSVDHDGYAHALEQLVDAAIAGDAPDQPAHPMSRTSIAPTCGMY